MLSQGLMIWLTDPWNGSQVMAFLDKFHHNLQKLSAYFIFGKHKNEHNRQKKLEMLESIMGKFWNIIDSGLTWSQLNYVF